MSVLPRGSWQKSSGSSRTMAIRAWGHTPRAPRTLFSSLIPVVIIIACIMSHSGLSEASLVEFTSFLVPEALYEIVATVIREAYANSDLALSVSLGALLWTASSSSTALARGLNAVYDVEEERDWIHRTVVSLLSVIVLIALLVGAIYLIFRGKVIRMLAMAMPGMIEPNVLENLSSTLVMLGVGILIFSLCCRRGRAILSSRCRGRCLQRLLGSPSRLGFAFTWTTARASRSFTAALRPSPCSSFGCTASFSSCWRADSSTAIGRSLGADA